MAIGSPPPSPTLVFVYGTLLQGEANHRVLRGAPCLGACRSEAAFTLHDLGPYPGLVAGGKQAVAGELYAVDAPTLAALDALEEHPEVYLRGPLRLEDGRVVASYFLRPDQVLGCPPIPSGDWRQRKAPPAQVLVVDRGA